MTEEKNIPEEELPDTSTQLPEEKSENKNPKSEEENEDTLKESIQPQTAPKVIKDSHGESLRTNPKPQTPGMEIHHHGHVHEIKKWKEYVFQFFMLFLAVFCGFFAEYQLEHTIENNREKQFIKSLINDLKADINRISIIIDQRTIRETRLDSLSLLLNNKTSEDQNNRIYYYAAPAARSLAFRFIPNDGTMQQLKNSGAFRLIRNRIAADSISRYDVTIRNLQRQGELEEQIIQDYRQASAKIFDALVFDRILDMDNNVRVPEDNPQLLPFQKSDLHTWNYKTYSMKALNKASRRDARLLMQQAKNLLITLQKQYHID